MTIEYKIAPSQMASEYIELRGQTRENSITVDTLGSYGCPSSNGLRQMG
jgi:fructose-specific phosphotransferase system component IIB